MGENFSARARKRAVLFAHIAGEMQKAFPVLTQEAEFRADAPMLLGQAYFLLSDPYKSKRIPESSLTDDYKKAALSALAVMSIRPFSPLEEGNVQRFEILLANPMMALWVANSWLADRDLLSHFGFDYLKRFYSTLLNVRIPSLSPFIEAVNAGDDHSEITSIILSRDDLDLIDRWVLKFKMLSEQKR
jgi:hypothetical protein